MTRPGSMKSLLSVPFICSFFCTLGIETGFAADEIPPANADVPHVAAPKGATKAPGAPQPGSTLETKDDTSIPSGSGNPAPQAGWQTRPGEKTPRKPVHNGKVVDDEHINDPQAPKDGYGKSQGIAGDLVFGPSVTLLGFPSPFKVNLESKWRNVVGAQFSYGFLPKITVSNASGKLNSWDVRLRAFPFEGAFYLGVAYGKQTVTASKDTAVIVSGSSYATTVSGEINNSFVAPHLGWRFVWKSGFFYGIDLGWQFQSGTTTDISYTVPSNVPTAIVNQIVQQPTYLNTLADVKDTANKLGNQGLPLLTLIQIGWLF